MARNVQMKNGGNRRRSIPASEARNLGYTEREWKRLNDQDRRERKKTRKLVLVLIILALIAAALVFAVYYVVFRTHDYDLRIPYDSSSTVYGQPSSLDNAGMGKGFAADKAVAAGDVNSSAIAITSYSAGLFDINNKKIDYAKDIFTTRSMASLTKVMTALVAFKYGNMDDMVTVTDTALDIEYGSSVCDIKPGERLSMKQLMYGMLIASGNDAAMMIAEHVGGSVDHFVEMMNEEALALGATRTHFMNPYGMTMDGHYTCAYDEYLMFSAAMNYDMFMDIISRKNYYAEYTGADDSPRAVTWESTDHYLTGEAATPDNVIIYGGKTGTTEDAGACLALLSKDAYGNPFFSVILHAPDKDKLYTEMNTVLSLVPAA